LLILMFGCVFTDADDLVSGNARSGKLELLSLLALI